MASVINSTMTAFSFFSLFRQDGRKYHLLDEDLVIPGRNVAKLLDDVFARYDKRIRPFYGGIDKQ